MEHTNRGRALTCILCSTCRQLSKISLIYKPNLRDVWITSEMIPAWRFAGGKMDQCTTAIRLTWSNCFFPLFPLYRRNIDMGKKEKKENPPHRPSFLLRLHTPGVELSTPQSFFFLPLSHNRSRHVRHISAYKSIYLLSLHRTEARPPSSSASGSCGWQGRRRHGNRAGPAAAPRPPPTWGGKQWEVPRPAARPLSLGRKNPALTKAWRRRVGLRLFLSTPPRPPFLPLFTRSN